MKKIVGVLMLMILAGVASAEGDESVDMRDLMTAREFQESGLYKLDAGELQALNQWLTRVVAQGDLSVVTADGESFAESHQAAANESRIQRPAADEFGREYLKTRRDEEAEALRTHIVGEFTGWEGGTRFELDNGQIWEQAQPGTYYYKLDNPEVIISKTGLLGAYRMRIVQTGRIINVRRVK